MFDDDVLRTLFTLLGEAHAEVKLAKEQNDGLYKESRSGSDFRHFITKQTDEIADLIGEKHKSPGNVLGTTIAKLRATKALDADVEPPDLTKPPIDDKLCSCGASRDLGDWHNKPEGWTCRKCDGFVPYNDVAPDDPPPEAPPV